MNKISISSPPIVHNSYWGLFLIAIITMLSDDGGYLGQGKMVFFLWVMFVGGIMYILTSGIKQRLIWWIALAPFALRGPVFLNIGIGVTSVIACFIIAEFLILYIKKIHVGHRTFTSELTFPFLLVIAALISIIFSPIAPPKLGPFLRFCMIIAIYSIAFTIFNQKEDVLLITKAIGFQLIMYLVYLVSEYYIKGGLVLFDNRLIGSNVTANMIVLSSPFLCLFKVVQRRKFFPLIIMTCAILVILTMSRCGYLIMLIDGIFLVTFYSQKLKKNERLRLGVFFLISQIFGIIAYNVYTEHIAPNRDSSTLERIVAAQSAYEGFLEYPLTGIGFGQWINSYEVMYLDDIQTFVDENSKTTLSRNPHNTFLRIALDTGGIGISIFMILLIRFGKMSIQLFKRHRSKHSVYDIACLCLNFVFLNLALSMLFGDFLESQQTWTIFFAIAVAYKNESVQNLISIEHSYSKSLHPGQRS